MPTGEWMQSLSARFVCPLRLRAVHGSNNGWLWGKPSSRGNAATDLVLAKQILQTKMGFTCWQ